MIDTRDVDTGHPVREDKNVRLGLRPEVKRSAGG